MPTQYPRNRAKKLTTGALDSGRQNSETGSRAIRRRDGLDRRFAFQQRVHALRDRQLEAALSRHALQRRERS